MLTFTLVAVSGGLMGLISMNVWAVWLASFPILLCATLGASQIFGLTGVFVGVSLMLTLQTAYVIAGLIYQSRVAYDIQR